MRERKDVIGIITTGCEGATSAGSGLTTHQAGPLYSAEDTEVQSNRAKAVWLLVGKGACVEILDITKGGPCKASASLTSLGS